MYEIPSKRRPTRGNNDVAGAQMYSIARVKPGVEQQHLAYGAVQIRPGQQQAIRSIRRVGTEHIMARTNDQR